MTENAPAGWYPQPDGSQRYWDGAAWTEHTAPGASAAAASAPVAGGAPAAETPQPDAAGSTGAETAGDAAAVAAVPTADAAAPGVPVPPPAAPKDERPLWQRKRVLIPAGAVVALFALGSLSALGDDAEDPEVAAPTESAEVPAPETTESAVPTTFTMPDVAGMNLQDAQDSLQALGSYILDQEDASGEDRLQINDSAWRVCTQEPAAETEVPIEATVLLASVKEDEACPGEEPIGEPADEEPADEPVTEAEPADEPDSADEPEPADDAPQETRAQENARESAEAYLAFAAFSRNGLIDQLEFEGFENDDAVYAVDAVGADWSQQAVASAEAYLDFSAFSHSGLIDQLEFEGFTSKQAAYGADNVGADWNEQAAKSAEAYLDFGSFSRAGLIDQLEFEGFTSAQATYGVDQAGL